MSSSMVNEAGNKFTWVIKDFSSLESEKIISDEFVIGGYKWRLVAYPKGTHTDCLFLGVVTYESLPLKWREHAKFSVKVGNQISEKSSVLREVKKWRVDQQVPFIGLLKFIPFAELYSKDDGFLVNDELKMVAKVDVQVMGGSDASEESDASDESEEFDASDASEESHEAAQPMKKTKIDDYGAGSSDLHKETRVGNEAVDVNGFQVSTSQVAYVMCIFEKHPDFASKIRSNNQHMKSTYMNVLLGLIETLCQLPEKLSDDDLDEASAAVSYLTQVGFKIDWLKEKLEEVREKKTKVYTGKAQLQHMEEEFQKFNKKCLELKDLVEKQNADVTAANVALSFNDVV